MTDLPTLPISRTLRLIADKLSEPHDQQSLLEAADMLERKKAPMTDEIDEIVRELERADKGWPSGFSMPVLARAAGALKRLSVERDEQPYVEMLWAWFGDEQRHGAEYMRSELPEGLSADDFKGMLDDHENELCHAIEKAEAELETANNNHREMAKMLADMGRRLEAAEAKLKWQPIETAPHATDVLLGWISWHTQEWICEVGQASHGWTRNGISTMSRHGSATHWQPLPDAPVGEGQRNG